MAKLDTAARKRLPARDFAGADRSYPVEDKAHARAAKSRASEMEHKGRLSPDQKARIDAKADSVLRGDKMEKKESKREERKEDKKEDRKREMKEHHVHHHVHHEKHEHKHEAPGMRMERREPKKPREY